MKSIFLFCLYSLTFALSSNYYMVDRVVDGDTFILKRGHKKIKIRLLNVDTPESVHPKSYKNTYRGKYISKQVRNKLRGKRVYAELESKDRYNRYLANVFLGDTNINIWLVYKGYSDYVTRWGKSSKYHSYFLDKNFLVDSIKG